MGNVADRTRENRKRHRHVCVMCGAQFVSARPESATEGNRCRSALRRWRALYGAAPVNPPGVGSLRSPYWDRAAFFRAYVDLVAYKKLHGKLPPGVELTGKQKRDS